MGKQRKQLNHSVRKSTQGRQRTAGREKTAAKHGPSAPAHLPSSADGEIAACEFLYRRIIETTHEGIRAIDLNGVTTYVNPRMAAMLGYRPDELVGRNVWDTVWPEDVAAWRAVFQQRKAQDGILGFDLRLLRKDGSFVWCHMNTNKITTTDGRLVGFFAMFSDITERKQAEQALRSSEERLRLALDAGRMGIWAWDLQTGRTVWNAKEYELLGLPAGEGIVAADLFFQHVHAEDRPELRRVVSELIERGTELIREFRIVRADGQVRWLATVGRLLRDADGQSRSLIGVNYDITEQKEVEEALRSSEEKFGRAFQANPASIAISQISDGRIIEVNDSFSRIFGYTREEAVGRTPLELGTYADMAYRQRMLKRLAVEGHVRDFELPIRTKDGRLRLARMAVERVSISGRPHLVTTTEDITDRKKAEAALRLKNLVFDASIAAISVADLDGVITEANDAFLRIWGYPSKDEAVGKPIHNFLNDPNEATAIVTAMNGTGQWEGDYTAKRRDGSTFIAHGLATVVRDEAGKMIGYQSAVMDITDRKRTEEALRETHARLAATLDALPDLLFVVDREGRIFDYRAPHPELLYVPPAMFIGRTMREVLPAPVAATLESAIADAIAHRGHHQGAVYALETPVGMRWFELSIAAQGNPQSPEGRLVTLVHDITDRKQAEEQLRSLNATLEQRVAERTALAESRAAQLRDLALQLIKAEEKERRRITNILHDHLQQTLVAAKLRVGLMRRHPERPAGEPLDHIQEALSEAIRVSRSLTVELCPPILYDGGLAQALQWLARWMQDRQGLQVNVATEPAPAAEELPPERRHRPSVSPITSGRSGRSPPRSLPAGWTRSTAIGVVCNLFMDYETFGEHQWADTGIFEFVQVPARQRAQERPE